jgi:hypothetical protein
VIVCSASTCSTIGGGKEGYYWDIMGFLYDIVEHVLDKLELHQ